MASIHVWRPKNILNGEMKTTTGQPRTLWIQGWLLGLPIVTGVPTASVVCTRIWVYGYERQVFLAIVCVR